VYVDVAFSRQNGQGYKRVLLRESYKVKGQVKHRTIANLSHCSEEEIQAIQLALKHKGDLHHLDALPEAVHTKQGLAVGALLLLQTLADRLHIAAALGPSVAGKFALWQGMARVLNQGARLSAVRLAGQQAVCDLLTLPRCDAEDLDKNLHWLATHQGHIDKRLFDRRYQGHAVPRLFVYDVTRSELEGRHNAWGDWGSHRDGTKGKLPIVIGLWTDETGVPVSIEVFQGHTHDPKTVLSQMQKMARSFGSTKVTCVGDRGMMKSAQIQDLKAEHCHYIPAITKPQIATLRKQDVFQIEQFTAKLCEMESDGLRYIVRSNPKRVEDIAQTRHDKIHKVQRFITRQNADLAQHQRAKVAGALRKSTQWLQQLKVSECAHVEAQERPLSLTLDAKKHAAISALDGGYVIKTELPQEEVAAETVHQRDKDLACVEQGFRTIKTGLWETRPIFVRKEPRTKGHVLVVMLAYILVQELQTLWAEMHITVEEGLVELSMLTTMEMQIGHTCSQPIPQPREVGRKLLELAHVRLPDALPSRNIKVAARKRLTRG
jgi:hypothetical protein